jgi:hypothetical protein
MGSKIDVLPPLAEQQQQAATLLLPRTPNRLARPFQPSYRQRKCSPVEYNRLAQQLVQQPLPHQPPRRT